MYEFIYGNIIDITPTFVVIEANQIGFLVHITLNTFSQIQNEKTCKLHIHQVIREDAHLLYGFFTRQEREIFRLLISVSGIGPNTARMMLSSLGPAEIQSAVLTGDVNALNSIKGIGIKSAQRIIVDLKDKIDKESETNDLFVEQDNTIKKEALSALELLGFNKKASVKVINKLLIENRNITVEELIKKSLKLL
jgi:Holliday junction DNA helicase RuvA